MQTKQVNDSFIALAIKNTTLCKRKFERNQTSFWLWVGLFFGSGRGGGHGQFAVDCIHCESGFRSQILADDFRCY